MQDQAPKRWYVGARNENFYIIEQPPRPSNDDVDPDRDVKIVAKIYQASGGPDEEQRRACLIAAAPDYHAIAEDGLPETLLRIAHNLKLKGDCADCIELRKFARRLEDARTKANSGD